jgi:hypothetical protein
MAERGAEDDRIVFLAAQAEQQRCRLTQAAAWASTTACWSRRADPWSPPGTRLEPVTALVELQDHLIPDYGVIIADDAKLNRGIAFEMS